MARYAGRNGRVYFAMASGGSAEPLNFVAKWELNFPSEKIDVTAMSDTRKTYVAGMADQTGSFSGFTDDASAQTYTAATDGIARKFYLYPDATNSPTKYWFGTVVADASFSAGVEGAGEFKSDFSAASDIIKVP